MFSIELTWHDLRLIIFDFLPRDIIARRRLPGGVGIFLEDREESHMGRKRKAIRIAEKVEKLDIREKNESPFYG